MGRLICAADLLRLVLLGATSVSRPSAAPSAAWAAASSPGSDLQQVRIARRRGHAARPARRSATSTSSGASSVRPTERIVLRGRPRMARAAAAAAARRRRGSRGLRRHRNAVGTRGNRARRARRRRPGRPRARGGGRRPRAPGAVPPPARRRRRAGRPRCGSRAGAPLRPPPYLVGQRAEDQRGRALQRLLHAGCPDGHRLEERQRARVEPLVQDLERQRVGQVALVVLEDHRDLVRVDLVGLQVLPQVLQALQVGVEHGLLAVRHEHHAVGALQHHAAGGVVEHLAGHGVELDARPHAADGAELDGQEVEEEGAVRLGGQREHLALVLDGQLLVDPLQVGGLAAQAGAVVDDLGGQLLGGVVEEDHAIYGFLGIRTAPSTGPSNRNPFARITFGPASPPGGSMEDSR